MTSILRQTELTPVQAHTVTNSQATAMKPMILAGLQSMASSHAAVAVQVLTFHILEGAPCFGGVALNRTDPLIYMSNFCH